MNTEEELNKTLLDQKFVEIQDDKLIFEEVQKIAQTYAKVEQALAVLSDLKTNKSYIYKGNIADILGFEEGEMKNEINTIWEKEIFNKIHPEHLLKKYQFEIYFFQFLKNISFSKRSNYYVVQNLLMLNQTNKYMNVLFRMFYLSSQPNGAVQYALCVYSIPSVFDHIDNGNGVIVNASTGDMIVLDDKNSKDILTLREKEILKLIDNSYTSKKIADRLSISVHTVSRHRQNILEKLRAVNSMDACKLAKSIRLI